MQWSIFGQENQYCSITLAAEERAQLSASTRVYACPCADQTISGIYIDQKPRGPFDQIVARTSSFPPLTQGDSFYATIVDNYVSLVLLRRK